MKGKSWLAIILFWFAGLFGWIFISVIASTAKGITGHTDLMWLVYIFGLITFFTLPIAIVVDIVKRIKNRKNKTADVKTSK